MAIDVNQIMSNILTMVLWPVLAGVIVVMFIWAGFIFLTAQGEPGKITQAKKAVLWGTIGIGVALAGFSAENIVKSILGV